jgi:RES domain-containing protein
MVAWRIAKKKYHPYDGRGAFLRGARWNSPGKEVVYASGTFEGAILEILAHSMRPRTLPGPHHAVRIEIPDESVEEIDPAELPGWEARDSVVARDLGDTWLSEMRTTALVVPSLPSRPIGRTVLINPEHSDADKIDVSDLFDVPWDERLF